MLNAPLIHPSPAQGSSPHGAPEPPRLELLSDVEYAQQRLSGTVWSRGPAPSLYRAGLIAGRYLARVGITANALTVASLALAGVAAVAAGMGHFLAATAAVLSSGLCDALDGIVARASGTTSRAGALLDSTVDRLSDALPLLGVAVYYADGGALVAVPVSGIVGVFMVSYIRARAATLGAELPALFMRRPERVLLLALAFSLGGVELTAVPFGAPFVLIGTVVLTVLSFAGGWLALKSARALLSDQVSLRSTDTSE